jgi:predicted dehydrogenase
MGDKKILRWGIVSTGIIAQQFCQDMAFVSNGKLAGVAARKLEDAESFAQKYDIEKTYQGYQALFDDPDIDIVYIATPHNFHYQNAYDALKAGKSVLCEKPITISSEESQKLSLFAKEQGLFLMEAMWTYFLPAIQQAKKWVKEGQIGKVKHIKADFGYPMPYDSQSRAYNRDLAGGCLLDMGIYPLAIANYFTDEPMTNLHVKSHFAPNGVDNDVIMLADAGETRLTLATSFQCKLPNLAYIIGEDGYIVIPDFWRASECSLYKLDDEIDSFSDQRDSIGLNYEANAVGIAIQQQLIEHPLMTHEMSLRLQKQMEQVKSHF